MPKFTKNGTFPTITKKEREWFDRVLASMTRVSRPELVDILTDGRLNSLPIVRVGAYSHSPWRELHHDKSLVYIDESDRKRQKGRSQVETLRIFINKRFPLVWSEAFPDAGPYPVDALGLTIDQTGEHAAFWRQG